MSNYKIDDKYFDTLNIDTLKNLLNETNSLLKETQDSVQSITNKSNDLFKILVVFTAALIGFVFTSNASLNLIFISGYYILLFGFLICKLYLIVYPKSNALVGSEPRKIITDEIVTKNEIINEKLFLIIMIQSKQNSIDNNRKLHHQLFIDYKLILKLLLIFIGLSIPLFFLFHQCLIPFLDMC